MAAAFWCVVSERHGKAFPWSNRGPIDVCDAVGFGDQVEVVHASQGDHVAGLPTSVGCGVVDQLKRGVVFVQRAIGIRQQVFGDHIMEVAGPQGDSAAMSNALPMLGHRQKVFQQHHTKGLLGARRGAVCIDDQVAEFLSSEVRAV